MGKIEKGWFSVSSAAQYLDVSRPTIYEYIMHGDLVAYRRPRSSRKWLKREDLDALNIDLNAMPIPTRK